MPTLDKELSTAVDNGRKLLVTYLCIGFPTLDDSVEAAVALANAGADILELGIPFSDPTADGPVIAAASETAIARGTGLSQVLEACKRIRSRTPVPIVLFGYYNPVFVFGVERFAQAAADAGADAALVVDLPPEEGTALRTELSSRGLALIPLLAPTTTDKRAELLLDGKQGPRGFAYYVSMTGVTGAQATGLREAGARAGELAKRSGYPTVVGFGIDGPEAAAEALRGAPRELVGVVVGSQVVRLLQSAATPQEGREQLRTFVTAMRRGLDGEVPPNPIPCRG